MASWRPADIWGTPGRAELLAVLVLLAGWAQGLGAVSELVVLLALVLLALVEFSPDMASCLGSFWLFGLFYAYAK